MALRQKELIGVPMVNRELVSVVIPTFNRAFTLKRTLESVLCQSYRQFEIVVVDDGSTDKTEEIAQRVADSRLRWVRHDKNLGAAAARNTGIKAARGNWVAFLDSDDEWLPTKLEAQLRAMEKEGEETAGICCGYFLHQDSQDPVEKIPHRPASWHKHLLLGCDLGPGTTLLVRKKAFDEIGLMDEAYARFEDWEWLLRFVKRYDLAVVPRPLARVYRTRNVSAQTVENAAKRIVKAYQIEARKYGGSFERRFLASRWFHLSWIFFSQGDALKGFHYLAKGLWKNPFVPPGMLLLIMDSIMGTNAGPKMSAWKRRKRQRYSSGNRRK